MTPGGLHGQMTPFGAGEGSFTPGPGMSPAPYGGFSPGPNQSPFAAQFSPGPDQSPGPNQPAFSPGYSPTVRTRSVIELRASALSCSRANVPCSTFASAEPKLLGAHRASNLLLSRTFFSFLLRLAHSPIAFASPAAHEPFIQPYVTARLEPSSFALSPRTPLTNPRSHLSRAATSPACQCSSPNTAFYCTKPFPLLTSPRPAFTSSRFSDGQCSQSNSGPPHGRASAHLSCSILSLSLLIVSGLQPYSTCSAIDRRFLRLC